MLPMICFQQLSIDHDNVFPSMLPISLLAYRGTTTGDSSSCVECIRYNPGPAEVRFLDLIFPDDVPQSPPILPRVEHRELVLTLWNVSVPGAQVLVPSSALLSDALVQASPGVIWNRTHVGCWGTLRGPCEVHQVIIWLEDAPVV